jgi:hypothetical protein
METIIQQLSRENADLKRRLEEAQEDLRAYKASNTQLTCTGHVLRARAEKAEAELARALEALEDMVLQFGYDAKKNGRLAVGTGGLSALEMAFSVLGWDDPHPRLEAECEAPNCHERATCGTPMLKGYKRLCGEHYAALGEEKGGSVEPTFGPHPDWLEKRKEPDHA